MQTLVPDIKDSAYFNTFEHQGWRCHHVAKTFDIHNPSARYHFRVILENDAGEYKILNIALYSDELFAAEYKINPIDVRYGIAGLIHRKIVNALEAGSNEFGSGG